MGVGGVWRGGGGREMESRRNLSLLGGWQGGPVQEYGHR